MAGVIFVLSFLIPPLGIPLGLYGLWNDFEKWKKYVFCIALGVASFAYCYYPLENTDLVRYAATFYEAGGKTLHDAAFKMTELANGGTSNLVIYNVFCWLIGRFGNYHHASAITTFTVYYIGLYISCSLGERMQTQRRHVIFYVVLLLICLNFYGIINNIRNVFSFSLITLAVYRDCVLKKRNINTLLLYLIPCFFHTSAYSIIILRFLAVIKGKTRYILFGFIFLSSTFISILYDNISHLGFLGALANPVKFIVTKAHYYYTDTDSSWGAIVRQSGSRRLASIFYLLIAAIIFFMYLRFQFEHRREIMSPEERDKDVFFTYSWLHFAYVLSCMTMVIYTSYWRYETNLLISAGGIVFSFLQNRQEKKTEQSHYIKRVVKASPYIPIMFISATGCMALWLRELISYSDRTNLVIGPLFSCPIIVAARQMLGL